MIPVTPVIVRPKSRWKSRSYYLNIGANLAVVLGTPTVMRLFGEFHAVRALEIASLVIGALNILVRELTGQPLAGSPADPTRPMSDTTPG